MDTIGSRGSGLYNRHAARMELKEVVASQALTKALTFQSPVARNNLERLRRVHPDATPTELAKRVTRYYLSLVTTSGAQWAQRGRSPVGVSHLGPSMSSLSRRRPFFTH
jgi:hypothetical protein